MASLIIYFLFISPNVSKNCALSVREMLESAMDELIEKGYTDANDANALGSRATDGKRLTVKIILLLIVLNSYYLEQEV